MNITEDYVSFEVAKLLKEKGFDVPCLAHWFIGTNRNFSISNTPQNWNEIKTDLDWLSCPTHQMAMKWLRDEKNILIYVYPVIDLPVKDNFTFYWRWDGKKKRHDAPHFGDKHNYESYEKAVEMALKYVLENLI